MCMGFSNDKIVIFAKENFEFCSQRSVLVHTEDDDTAFLTFSSFNFLASFFFPCLVGYIRVENVFRKAFRVLESMKGKGDGRWNKILAFTLYSYCLFSGLLDWIVETSMTERLTPRTLDLEVRGSSLTRRVFVSSDNELYSSLSLFC